LWQQATHPAVPVQEGVPTWTYYAIALLGAAMTPTRCSSSPPAVEEHRGPKNVVTARLNVFVGFPLGGRLSLSIMARAAVLLGPAGIEVDQLSQVAIPVALGAGKLGLAVVSAGFFAATIGTAMETSMSCNDAVGPVLG
jgi:manganese transport protein